ncbi:arginine and glutamate-rich 1 domain-containing protein [Ditylenchus destructor]|uniref:Arginine and glutamate-rich 1 domain-containing protein n=1 Tax=Ditylenchus destructor TaxID=166010 RepID=A0AAD4N131_9BILA|nr:arginine and glutamate-rich 1 domain-containing protein [Ditylenchus destructor]
MGRSPSPVRERTRDRDRDREDRYSSSRSNRKRSRSRGRYEDRDRSSRHKSSRSERDRRRRSRTRSPRPVSPVVGPTITYEDSPSPSRPVVPVEIANELTAPNTGIKFNSAHLSKAAMEWLEEKIAEQVTARVREFDDLVREKVSKAKLEMEQRLRAQIEQEMKDEMEAMERRERESKERCSAMERELQEKIKAVEESERKLNESRLEMLEVKGKLEMERALIQKEKEALTKNEQQSILNKGGSMRPKIKMTLGKL